MDNVFIYTSAELFNETPSSFTLISCPHPHPTILTKSHNVGGGNAFCEPATLLSTHSITSFEMSSVTIEIFSPNLTVFMSIVLLQLPHKLANLYPLLAFLLILILSLAATIPHEFLITGDFNIYLDNPDDSQVQNTNYKVGLLKLHSTIQLHSTNASPHFQPRNTPTNLTVFTPVSREELSKLIYQSSNILCDLDLIPRSLLKQ